jgi:hypothetical protein
MVADHLDLSFSYTYLFIVFLYVDRDFLHLELVGSSICRETPLLKTV